MIRILALILAFLPNSTRADPAVIRSGEHGNFTRLVVSTRNTVTWDLAVADQVATLAIEGWNQGFDISQTFRRIDRSRVAGLSEQDGALRISLGCDCAVVATPFSAGGVILDIAASSQAPVSPLRTEPALTDLNQDAAPRLPLLRSKPNKTKPGALPKPAELYALRQRLAEELGRSLTTEESQPIGTPPAQGTDLARPTPTAERFRVTTAQQRAANLAAPDVRGIGRRCAKAQDLALSTWGDAQGFSAAAATHRRNLYGEFDTVSISHAVSLIRLHFHYGFVEEGLTILSALKLPDLHAAPLHLLGALLEGRELPASHGVHADCGGQVGLLALLDPRPEKLATSTQYRELTQEFNALPSHLRSLLGARFIKALEDVNMPIVAESFRSILTRSIQTQGKTAGEFTHLTDNTAKHEASVRAGRSNGPEALAKVLQVKTDAQEEAPSDLVELAEVFVDEFEGTQTAKTLDALSVTAHALAGDFREAANALSEFRKARADDYPALLDEVIAIAQQASALDAPAVLADAVLSQGLPLPQDMQRRDAFAAAILEAGLPGLALDLLESFEGGAPDSVVQAKALAELGQTERAIAMLNRLPSEETQILLTRLLADTQGPAAALDAATDLASPSLSEALNWRAGRFEAMTQEGPRKGLAALIEAPRTATDQPEVLANTSQELRGVVSALLGLRSEN